MYIAEDGSAPSVRRVWVRAAWLSAVAVLFAVVWRPVQAQNVQVPLYIVNGERMSEEQVKVNIFRARQAVKQKFDEIERYGL